MVAQGDDIHPVFHELARQPWDDALAAGCVLSVHHNDIYPMLCP